MRARKELRPSDVTAICDSREGLPYDLSPMKMVCEGLDTADYSVKGLEMVIAVERKELSDFLNCCGQGRERFERECMRLLAFPSRVVVVEASWRDLEMGRDIDGTEWRSKITPEAATGSVIGWTVKGIPFHFAGNRASAQLFVARFLFQTARRRWNEMQGLCDTLKISSLPEPEPVEP